VEQRQFLAFGQHPPCPGPQEPRHSPKCAPVVHVLHGEKQTKLVVTNLVSANSRDLGQLGQHPHGLAVDRHVPGVEPVELAVPTGRDREAFGVGCDPETQGADDRPEPLKG